MYKHADPPPHVPCHACSWMYEDGQDEVVFSVDRPCQLLGAGLCGTEGGFTVELEVYEVRLKHLCVWRRR